MIHKEQKYNRVQYFSLILFIYVNKIRISRAQIVIRLVFLRMKNGLYLTINFH